MLTYHQLGAAVPPTDPATLLPALQFKTPAAQTIKVKSMSLINALTIGAISGFAMSFGAFLFEKISKRSKR